MMVRGLLGEHEQLGASGSIQKKPRVGRGSPGAGSKPSLA